MEKLISNCVKFKKKSMYIKFCIKIVGLNGSYLTIYNQSENGDITEEPYNKLMFASIIILI